MLKLRKKSGFTLIELLIVIAIIGILAVLIIVALSRARTSANDAKVKEAVNSYAKAEEMYKDEFPANNYQDKGALVPTYMAAPPANIDGNINISNLGANTYTITGTMFTAGKANFVCDQTGCR